MTVQIYALVDPNTGVCRYVGKTKHSIEKRLKGHLSDAYRFNGKNIPRFSWINKLLSFGQKPKAILLEIVHDDDWQAAEQMWVHEMRGRFQGLLNATNGGDGIHGHQHSNETRLRQSESARRRYEKPGEKEKTSLSVRASFSTQEGKDALSSAAKKRWANPEYREALSSKLADRSRTPQSRARTSAIHKGKVVSAEQKAKISSANTGKRWTDEMREAASIRRLGKKHSPETIEKMKAAYARRKAMQDG